jgi:hypothetical protein
MKVKQLMAIAAATAVGVGAYAQSIVNFANTGTSKVYVTNNVAMGINLPINMINGTFCSNSYQISFGLYYDVNTNGVANPGATPDAFTLVPGSATTHISGTSQLAGIFSGGNVTVLPAPSAGGEVVLLQVRAWSGGLVANGPYNSFEAAYAAG